MTMDADRGMEARARGRPGSGRLAAALLAPVLAPALASAATASGPMDPDARGRGGVAGTRRLPAGGEG